MNRVETEGVQVAKEVSPVKVQIFGLISGSNPTPNVSHHRVYRQMVARERWGICVRQQRHVLDLAT